MTQKKIEKANSYTEWAEASLNHIWAYDDDVNDTERISLILGILATEFAAYLDMHRRPTSLDDMLEQLFGKSEEEDKEDDTGDTKESKEEPDITF